MSTAPQRQGVPFKPDWSAVPRTPPRDSFVRAVAARLLFHHDPTRYDGIDGLARSVWPNDTAVPLILKAAVSPATTASVPTVARVAVVDFITSMTAVSAGAALIAKAPLNLQFDGAGSIRVPGLLTSASDASFVLEGDPIPAQSLGLTGPSLVPKKMSVIAGFSGELFQHSIPSIESVVRSVLMESIGAALDATMFDAVAVSTTRPAGLRNGATTITPSAAGAATDARMVDLGNLIGAVARTAGSGPIAVVMAPEQYAEVAAFLQPTENVVVLSSAGLAEGVIMAIALNAVAFAVDAVPQFELVNTGVIHFEDTSPLPIGTVGSPATVAAPSREIWQSNILAVKLRLQADWVTRGTGAVSQILNTSW